VDGAIHRAAGPSVMAELDKIRARSGNCATGKAVVTGAGRLRTKHIIHAVGPVYRGGGLVTGFVLPGGFAAGCRAWARSVWEFTWRTFSTCRAETFSTPVFANGRASAECRRPARKSACATLFLQATFSRNPSYRLEPVLVQFSFSRSKTLRAWEWDFTRTSIGLAQSWKAIGSLFSLASIADWMDLWVGPSGIFAGRTLFCVLPVFRCAHRQTFALFVRME